MRTARLTSRSVSTGVSLAVVASTTVGCQEQELPHFGTLRYQSDAFEVWASDDLEACGGTYEYTERWLAAFRKRVGDYGNPGKHTFYWLSAEDFGHEPCSSGIACAYPYSNVIYSTVIPAEHEIVHTQLDAQPPSVLGEGAAEVFGSIESLYTTEVVSLEPLLDEERISGLSYQTAGRFSRFIIERYGLDDYFALYDALDGSQGHDAFAVGVEEALGIGLPELVESFEQSSPCSVDRWRFFDHECSSLPLTAWKSPTRWTDTIDLSCTADDVIGPRRGLVWTLRGLGVEHAGLYQLTIESSDPTAQVAIFSCDVNCFDGRPVRPTPSTSVATGGTVSVLLDAGRHWVRVEHAADSDAPVAVLIER